LGVGNAGREGNLLSAATCPAVSAPGGHGEQSAELAVKTAAWSSVSAVPREVTPTCPLGGEADHDGVNETFDKDRSRVDPRRARLIPSFAQSARNERLARLRPSASNWADRTRLILAEVRGSVVPGRHAVRSRARPPGRHRSTSLTAGDPLAMTAC